MTPIQAKREHRLRIANDFIRVIASHGRRFFYYQGYVTRLEVDARGRIWLVDKYMQKRVDTHRRNSRWNSFTEGGTMRGLVESLRDYVLGRAPLPLNHLGPAPEWMSGGDPWGYGPVAMDAVRRECAGLENGGGEGVVEAEDGEGAP